MYLPTSFIKGAGAATWLAGHYARHAGSGNECGMVDIYGMA